MRMEGRPGMNILYEYQYDTGDRFVFGAQTNSYCLAHFHSCFEIMYVLEGLVVATVNGVTRRLGPGELYVAGSFDIHSMFTEGRSKTLVFIIPESYLGDFLSFEKGRVFFPPFLSTCAQSKEIFHCLEKLTEDHQNEAAWPIRCRGYLSVIFGLLAQSIPLRDAAGEQDRLVPQKILLYLHEHFNEKLALSDVASHFGYTAIYFSHYFRKYFGFGFSEYINMLRVQHAASLFGRCNSFLTAALESGFENQRTFNRAFKKITGQTPSEYRKAVKLEKDRPS